MATRKLASAQDTPTRILIPFGGGYQRLAEGFIPAVLERAGSQAPHILVLPLAFADNPEYVALEPRTQLAADAEIRRSAIEQACLAARPSAGECRVELAPVFVRRDAEAIPIPTYLPPDLDAVFLLGGDQTVAARVLAGTPLERALDAAYARGVIIAGTSAGAALQSQTMLAGYRPSYDESRALDFGAVDVWQPPERGGLPFGLQTALIDQHFYQRNRFARLINAIALPEAPHVGLGLDAETGVLIEDERRLSGVFGGYTLTILDAETYHAAAGVRYAGAEGLPSLRNILVHVLAPGRSSFDLQTRHSSTAPNRPRLERFFAALSPPRGAGRLYLGGDLKDHLPGHPALLDFVNTAGGHKARIQIFAAGYSDRAAAQRAAAAYAAELKIPSTIRVITAGAPAIETVPQDITGILLIGDDPARIDPEGLVGVRQAWLSGLPLFADNAGAAVLGRYYTTNTTRHAGVEQAETFAQRAFIQGVVTRQAGLSLFDVMIEPQVAGGGRWGRWFSLAYNHASYPAFALAEGAALLITPGEARVLGNNAVYLLDLSLAALSLGSNQAFAISGGMMDVFAPGDRVEYRTADQAAAPLPAATPQLPTPTPVPSPVPTLAPLALTLAAPPAIQLPTAAPTDAPPRRTPRPTPTHITLSLEAGPENYTPTDPRLLRIIIALGVFTAIVVLLGVWITRRRLNLR